MEATGVKLFEEMTADQRSLAGGKGGTLAQLYQLGYPVPNGLVILPAAFAHNGLNPQAWEQVREMLALLRNGNEAQAFAVRSSALAEDSMQASFAGEFETVLEVRSDEGIYKATNAVRQSRLNERVEAYSQAKNLDTDHEIAVVIQKMIPAELSGVLFTADPITGGRQYMPGNFVSGLGHRLVSGEIDAKTFTFSRPQGKYNGPTQLKTVALKLFKLAIQLERELGGPQDIEWAMARGQLHLLQSRPITTLIANNPHTGEWNDSLTGDFLWSNVNLGEAMPDVMTPFTWSILQQGALAEWIEFQGFKSFGNIGGRPYFNISIFASMLELLGRNEEQKQAALEGLLHFKLPKGVSVPTLPTSKRMLLPAMMQMMNMYRNQRRDIKNLPNILNAIPDWCREIRTQISEAETGADLATLWTRQIKPFSTAAWSAYLNGTNHYAEFTIKLRQKLEKLVGPDDADLLISGMSSESEQLASLGPVLGLFQVARGQMSRESYLQEQGHRGPHEFEFSIPRPAEDPSWLDRQLAELARTPVDVTELLAKRRAETKTSWQRLCTHYPQKAKVLGRQIEQIAPRGRLRESIRSEFAKVTWIFRVWALRAGELTGLREDVFFLRVKEILDVLQGEKQAIHSIPVRKKTHQRYQALPAYPPIIKGRFDPFQWAADPQHRSDVFDSHAPLPASSSTTLTGAAGSAGRVEGVVRILDCLDEGEVFQKGEILVTAQTNIGWTPLFPRAAAIITDVGAPLSHAAIVARELGIPAVVGCGDATTQLQTGDRVQVDGGRGIVTILD